MDISKLVRNPKMVIQCAEELPNDVLVAKKRVRIYIPARFEEIGLATIGSEILIAGIYAMVTDDGFYGVSTVNAMIRITPTSINTIKVDGDTYYEFLFEPGAVMIPNLNLLCNDVLTYYVFDEFFAKGKVPWYIGYDDIGSIFDTSNKHAGINFGQSREIIEMVASIIARSPKNRYEMYRHFLEKPEQLLSNPPAYVPLGAIQFTATNTTAKIGGSYTKDGLVSALVNPSERTERIENLLIG